MKESWSQAWPASCGDRCAAADLPCGQGSANSFASVFFHAIYGKMATSPGYSCCASTAGFCSPAPDAEEGAATPSRSQPSTVCGICLGALSVFSLRSSSISGDSPRSGLTTPRGPSTRVDTPGAILFVCCRTFGRRRRACVRRSVRALCPSCASCEDMHGMVSCVPG